MSPLDAVWHILNFLAPAIFVALFTAVGAKLIFSSSLRSLAWPRLFSFAAVPTVLAAFAGLVFTGRDGAMLTYSAMVLAAASGCWLASLQIWRT